MLSNPFEHFGVAVWVFTDTVPNQTELKKKQLLNKKRTGKKI